MPGDTPRRSPTVAARDRSRTALAERDRLLELLFEFSQALVSAPDVKGICASAFDVLARILDWRIGVVYLRSEEHQGRLVQVHSRNVPPELAERIRALPIDESSQSGTAARRGEVILTSAADYAYPRYASIIRDARLGGVVSLPLNARDRLQGVLTVFTVQDPSNAVPQWLRPGLGTLARLLAQSLSNARLFADLVDARAELRRVDESLNDLTYVASHDVKEPLRTLQAYCRTLQADFADALDEPGRALVSSIAGSADHLQRLVDDLLGLATVGRDRGPTVDIDVEALVGRVLLTFAERVAQRGAQIRALAPLPRVRGDVAAIERVVQHLVSNGLTFNESRTPTVEIGHAADKRSHGGRPDRPDRRIWHTLFVRDNGVGIPPAQQDAIFAPFRRLQPRGVGDGTGAGLAVVRRIVEIHGGRVWVESQPGKGATFFFTLPAATDELPV
jgi:signal transduction histidine kinase